MRRFWTVLHAVTVLVHIPFALGLRRVLARAFGRGALADARAPTVVAIVTTVALVAALRLVLADVRCDRPRPRWRTQFIEKPYYAHWCATLGSAILFVPAALAVATLDALAPWSARDGTLQALASAAPSAGSLAAGAYAFFLVLAVYGVFVRTGWVRVRIVDVPVAGLASAFDGYRIAHLSDLHVGTFSPRERAETWRARVNALDVDLVALTGDYVTSGVAFHDDIAAVLSGLRAKDGTVAVMGNHDYFGDGEQLVTLLRDGGITVLRNENASIERGGERLAIAGVDDTWTRRADVERAVEGRDVSIPLVALAHDPELFPSLAAKGASLVLSGHTHWGQASLPFFATRFNMSRLTSRYHAGTYREGDSTLVVTPGLGTTGPPARLGSPPEITIVRLFRTTSAAHAPVALRAESAERAKTPVAVVDDLVGAESLE